MSSKVKIKTEPDKSKLTDEECDFIIQRVLWKLRDTVGPIDFFREMGRGVLFEVSQENKQKARELVRLFVRGDG
jgi:hypothetical protein